jgi:hypothetical protein
MDALQSAGAAAMQRHRIREKMSSILLEHDPSAAASRTHNLRRVGDQRKCTPLDGVQNTAEVVTPKLLPFPDPARNHIGLEGMTQTIIDDDDICSPGARRRNYHLSEAAVGVRVNENERRQPATAQRRSCRSFSITNSSRRRSMKRHCREEAIISTQHVRRQRLGDIYDLQLVRRTMNSSSSRQKQQHHAVPQTTRDGRAEDDTTNEAVTSPLSPVKSRLYQKSKEEDKHHGDEEEEQLLTPVKMEADDEMPNESRGMAGQSDSSPDEDPFATIGYFLRLME